MLPPCIDMVTFSMDQMHAALDTRPQMFTNMTEDDGKEEEKKEDDEHVGQDVAPDGHIKDTADKEEKDGGSGTMA